GASLVGIVASPTIVDLDIASFNPAQVLEALQQRGDIGLSLRITLGVSHEHADAPHPLGLPRPRRERPCSRRAAEQYDEVAPSQSITSSARSRIGVGTTPALRLPTSRFRGNRTAVRHRRGAGLASNKPDERLAAWLRFSCRFPGDSLQPPA